MRVLLFFLILSLGSCGGEKLPKDVLPMEKMENVMYDIILADEFVDFASMQDSTYRGLTKRAALYDSVFQLHAIKKEDYRKSINYYQSRPDLLKEIFDSLHTRTDSIPKREIKELEVIKGS